MPAAPVEVVPLGDDRGSVEYLSDVVGAYDSGRVGTSRIDEARGKSVEPPRGLCGLPCRQPGRSWTVRITGLPGRLFLDQTPQPPQRPTGIQGVVEPSGQPGVAQALVLLDALDHRAAEVDSLPQPLRGQRSDVAPVAELLAPPGACGLGVVQGLRLLRHFLFHRRLDADSCRGCGLSASSSADAALCPGHVLLGLNTVARRPHKVFSAGAGRTAASGKGVDCLLRPAGRVGSGRWQVSGVRCRRRAGTR